MPFVPIEATCAPAPAARAAHWSESVNARVFSGGLIDATSSSSPAGATISGQSVNFTEVESNKPARLSKWGAPLDRPTMRPITDPEIVKALRGRPSEYRPEFCEMLLEDAMNGFSLSAFAGRIGVAPNTLTYWAERNPEFSSAVARAKAVRLRDWEADAITVRQTGGQGSQATMIIFGLKNMGSDDWKEKQEIAHSGAISLSALISDSMKTIEHVPDMIEQSPVADGATNL